MQSDYFALLGVERGVEIDTAALHKNYLELQKEFHPDKNAYGFEQSSRLNEAYSTLKSKFKRLAYLVELVGAEIKSDQALFMEVMELREEYENDPKAVGERIAQEIEELFKAAGVAFKAGKMDDMAAKSTKIKYLQNVITNP